MNEIRFNGCSTAPLGSYLKALGIMRILSEQADEGLLGWWKDGVFIISTLLSEEDVVDFFLSKYSPTPIITPWNKDSGFYKDKGTATDVLKKIEISTDARFSEYRKAISCTRRTIARLGIDYSSIENKKHSLEIALRNELPDSSLAWIDSVYIVSVDSNGKTRTLRPHILGTGGNDARLDLAVNFMNNVVSIFEDKDIEERLLGSLFGIEEKPAGKGATVGMFYPGGVGGPNATEGFEGDSLINPWDFILMLEGVVLFAGSASRRFSANQVSASASSPFSVTASAVGYASASVLEERGASRGETWVPVWEKPATLSELVQIFSEGRANIGRRRANSGLDFARAVASLGVDRGIKGFYRYSFLQRSGKSNHIAVPLDFHYVSERSVRGIDLIREIDPWLDAVRRFVEGENTPSSKTSALRGLQQSIYEFSVRGDKPSLQKILEGIGHMEEEISTLPEKEGKDESKKPQPLHGLSSEWVKACDDCSPEFALAVGLASLRGSSSIPPMRHYFEPVEINGGRLVWKKDQRAQVKNAGSISMMLVSMLERICLDIKQSRGDNEERFSAKKVDMKHVNSFLNNEIDEARFLRLLKGLMLVNWPVEPQNSRGDDFISDLNRDYIILKAMFLNWRVVVGQVELGFNPQLKVLNLLRAGNVETACCEASRRLRAMMLVPAGNFGLSGVNGRRLAAALIFPVDVNEFAGKYLPLILNKKDVS
jgi:CRISPR-associated protein Csx17